MTTIIKDVAIIGAGPVGLFAVFQCGMLGLSTVVIDSLSDIGGQCTALYPEKPIYDIPGFPSVAAGDLIHHLEAQAAPFNPEYLLGQTVEKLEKVAKGDIHTITTSAGNVIEAKAVVIAAGGGAFGPNRPPLESLSNYEGKSVFYMIRRREDFRGKKVVIAGGGDSAVDWALSLVDVADSVVVVHRRDQFRAAPESVTRMRTLAAEGRIEMVVPYQLQALDGTDGQLSAVIVADLDGVEKRLGADVLLPFFGLATSLGPIADWKLDIAHHHIVVDRGTAETNVPGIYAIGDIATYSHKLKLILTGFADAAQAAYAVYKRIHPDVELHMEYSTTKGVPTALQVQAKASA